jgi:hypothetical protein
MVGLETCYVTLTDSVLRGPLFSSFLIVCSAAYATPEPYATSFVSCLATCPDQVLTAEASSSSAPPPPSPRPSHSRPSSRRPPPRRTLNRAPAPRLELWQRAHCLWRPPPLRLRRRAPVLSAAPLATARTLRRWGGLCLRRACCLGASATRPRARVALVHLDLHTVISLRLTSPQTLSRT